MIQANQVTYSDERFTGQQIHRELTRIAKARSALDADEARWIRRALVARVWVEFGMVSIFDYLERVVGYAPRTAADRVRVAKELGELHGIEGALEAGKLAYSAVRELTRVATPDTEWRWLAHVANCNLREIEQAVTGRQKGVFFYYTARTEIYTRRIWFELTPVQFARWRQAQSRVRGDGGRRLEDGEVFAVMCEAVLERTAKTGAPVAPGVVDAVPASASASASADPGEPIRDEPANANAGDAIEVVDLAGMAVEDATACPRGPSGERAATAVLPKPPAVRHQIVAMVCEVCKQGWMRAAGVDVAIGAGALEMARCDAVDLGSIEGERQRARHTIPPAVRAFVFARDGERCRVPGCRSSFALDLHHMIHQAAGGDDDPMYLIVTCGNCHLAHHEGRIHISGNARDVRVDRPALWEADRLARAHVGGDDDALARLPGEARSALKNLGYAATVARAAVADAIETGADTLEDLIRAALQSPHVQMQVQRILRRDQAANTEVGTG